MKARWHPVLEGLVHHSDQGVQYASSEYTECLKAHNIAISMSRKGQPPLDNPFAESFIKTLKVEEVYLFEYETRQEAFTRIPQFIEDVYNRNACIHRWAICHQMNLSSNWKANESITQ